jgi:hypothetical protein
VKSEASVFCLELLVGVGVCSVMWVEMLTRQCQYAVITKRTLSAGPFITDNSILFQASQWPGPKHENKLFRHV